jgi:predicted MPP superfamily phosphohydrolase
VWIAGCDSAWGGGADMASAMRGRGPGEACLALVHEPELAFAAEPLGAQLILAGHTHGGQVRLPLVGAPYTHRVDRRIRIASGFQRVGPSLLHISAGLGHSIPLRFGCPPEAVWLDCRPAAVARPQLTLDLAA